VEAGLQGDHRTIDERVGRGGCLGRNGRRIRAAQREGRSAVGVPWPTERMVVSSSGLPWGLPHPTATRPVEGARRLGWRWRLPAYLDDRRAAVGLWSLLAITLLMAAVAVYSLLTGTVILGGG
jgi:hypothetical protein